MKFKSFCLFITIFLASIFNVNAYETDCLIGLSVGPAGISAKVDNQNADSWYTNIGFTVGDAIYPNGKTTGIFLGNTINFINVGGNSKSKINNSNWSVDSFGCNTTFMIGPAFRTPPDSIFYEVDSMLLRFSPCFALGAEFESGKIKTKYTEVNYFYTGLLFGFGCDLQFTLISDKKYSFGFGLNGAWYPFYSPKFKVDDKNIDVDYDSYGRYTGNIYFGLTIHNKK